MSFKCPHCGIPVGSYPKLCVDCAKLTTLPPPVGPLPSTSQFINREGDKERHPFASTTCPKCGLAVPCEERGNVIFKDEYWQHRECPNPPIEQPEDKAADLLDEAKRIVTGARRQSYGNPEDNFKCIAELWSIYLNRRLSVTGVTIAKDMTVTVEHNLTPADVCVMMIMMKGARLAETPCHPDSLVDIAGYAACGARL